MIRNFQPELVSIEGDDSALEIAELMGIDYDDADIIASGELPPGYYRYFEDKYPEYMGIAPLIIGKIISGVVGIGKGIADAVKNAKKKKSDAAAADKKKKEEAAAAAAAAAAEQKRQSDQKTLMMIGIPAAALLLFMALKK